MIMLPGQMKIPNPRFRLECEDTREEIIEYLKRQSDPNRPPCTEREQHIAKRLC